MITISPTNIPEEYSKKLAAFFNMQSEKINVWQTGHTYAFEDGTPFQFTSEVIKRQRNERKMGYRYEFISDRLLGKGTFGDVYEIEGTLVVRSNDVLFKPHGLNNKTRAVKIQKHDDKNPIETILKEYNLSIEASHLGIKRPTIDGQTSYTVMKKLKGQELFTLIDEDLEGISLLTLKQRTDLTRLLLHTLKKQITDKGIIHRDVKIENILVDLHAGLVNFFDFGLSVKANALDGKCCGTPAYAPPEIFFRGKQTVKIDVFSLGRVLALIWRVNQTSYMQDDLQLCGKNSRNVNLDSLFTGLEDLIDPDNKQIIRSMLKGMLQADVDSRFTIEQAIALFTQLTLAPSTPALTFPPTDDNTVFIQHNLVHIKIQAIQLSSALNHIDLNAELKRKIGDLARNLHSKIDRLSQMASQNMKPDLSQPIREAQELIRKNQNTFVSYTVGPILTKIGLDLMTMTLADLSLNIQPIANSENQFRFFKETPIIPNKGLSEEADISMEKSMNQGQ
ncbi:protein kinase [Legionella lytica]|uniref:Protein kinase n=1 Tax=Legionella lytica TaxID=96232 RepID=A0ABW8DC32_9GAMM